MAKRENLLCLLREKAGFKSQAELAKKVGTSTSCVSSWETRRFAPDSKNLKLIIDALGIDEAEQKALKSWLQRGKKTKNGTRESVSNIAPKKSSVKNGSISAQSLKGIESAIQALGGSVSAETFCALLAEKGIKISK